MFNDPDVDVHKHYFIVLVEEEERRRGFYPFSSTFVNAFSILRNISLPQDHVPFLLKV